VKFFDVTHTSHWLLLAVSLMMNDRNGGGDAREHKWLWHLF